jgi:hypothetical protein
MFASCRLTAYECGRGSAAPDRSVVPVKVSERLWRRAFLCTLYYLDAAAHMPLLYMFISGAALVGLPGLHGVPSL